MDDAIEVVLVGGEVRCIYLNDFRIAGSRPWAGESQKVTTFKVENGEIRKRLKRAARVKP